jgi:hypothetical protein
MVQPSLGVQRYGTVTAQTAFASPHRTGKALLPRGAVNQSPLNDYRTIVEAKLKPALGKLRLPQLDPVTLDRFYGRLRRDRNDTAALSTSRVRQVHAVLSGALGLAARYGWISFNPARLARPRLPRR